MSRMILLIVLCFLIGLSIGYAIFAQAGGDYIPIKNLVSIESNQSTDTLKEAMKSLGDSIEEALLNMKTRRRNILISGLTGGILGALLYAFSQKNKGRK